MDQRILDGFMSAQQIADIYTGAYGYLSAAVDNFLHSAEVGRAELEKDFTELQVVVSKALSRYFAHVGTTRAEVMKNVLDDMRANGASRKDVSEVAWRLGKMFYPMHPVTET